MPRYSPAWIVPLVFIVIVTELAEAAGSGPDRPAVSCEKVMLGEGNMNLH